MAAARQSLKIPSRFFLPLLGISVFLLPAEAPLLAQGTPVITTGIGQSLSIPCMLLDGIPLPERHWSRNGKPVRLISLRHTPAYATCLVLHYSISLV